MKFYLLVLGAFAILVLGALFLQKLSPSAQRIARMETMSREYILKQLRDPSSVKWNGDRLDISARGLFWHQDFTATNALGGPVRETWICEFDQDGTELRSVKPGDKPLVRLVSR